MKLACCTACAISTCILAVFFSAVASFFCSRIAFFNADSAALGQTGNEYAVFGKWTQGLTVLDDIGNSATGPSVIEGNQLASRPLVDIVLQSVTRTQ